MWNDQKQSSVWLSQPEENQVKTNWKENQVKKQIEKKTRLKQRQIELFPLLIIGHSKLFVSQREIFPSWWNLFSQVVYFARTLCEGGDKADEGGGLLCLNHLQLDHHLDLHQHHPYKTKNCQKDLIIFK